MIMEYLFLLYVWLLPGVQKAFIYLFFYSGIVALNVYNSNRLFLFSVVSV